MHIVFSYNFFFVNHKLVQFLHNTFEQFLKVCKVCYLPLNRKKIVMIRLKQA